MSQVAPPMNDDQSPLTTLISCVECAKTMRIEKIDPDGKGRDMIQYRCDSCGRIERLRLIRRTWPSGATNEKVTDHVLPTVHPEGSREGKETAHGR